MRWNRLLMLLLAALCVASPAYAFNGKKIALVIANGAYADGLSPLENPAIDANLVAQALRREGFSVTVLQDADLESMKRAVVDHAERLRDAGSGAISYIHYSGHGAADANRSNNYLIPVGAAISSELALPTLGYRLSDMVATVEAAKPAISIISIDACRNVAFPHAINRSGAKGLARIDEARGTLIAFATAPGSVAEDGPGEQGSTFSRVLAEEISKGGETHVDVFKNVQIAVSDATNGRQVPWYEDGIVGRFTFETDGSAPPPTEARKRSSTTRAAHQVVQESESEQRARTIEARESIARMGLPVDEDGFVKAIYNGDKITVGLYTDAKISIASGNMYPMKDELDKLDDSILNSMSESRIFRVRGNGEGFVNGCGYDSDSLDSGRINLDYLRYFLIQSKPALKLLFLNVCGSRHSRSIWTSNIDVTLKYFDLVFDSQQKFSQKQCLRNYVEDDIGPKRRGLQSQSELATGIPAFHQNGSYLGTYDDALPHDVCYGCSNVSFADAALAPPVRVDQAEKRRFFEVMCQRWKPGSENMVKYLRDIRTAITSIPDSPK